MLCHKNNIVLVHSHGVDVAMSHASFEWLLIIDDVFIINSMEQNTKKNIAVLANRMSSVPYSSVQIHMYHPKNMKGLVWPRLAL